MLQVSKAGRRYGYLRDKPDHRDFGVRNFPSVALTSASMPPSIDLEANCGPVKDQGDLGACTAFAGTGMREFLLRAFDYRSDVTQAPVLSPMFLYYMERKIDGDLDQGDTGSFGRTSCIAMNTYGICPESEDVYSPKDFQTPPTDKQIADALKFKAGAYHRLTVVSDMKSCLASKYCFVIGFTVYSSFESMSGQFIYNPDIKNEDVLGGHEVLAIGYDDSLGAFKIRNSWGSGWGNSGNFWMPYSVAADGDILQDSYIQHIGKPW